MLSIVEVVSIDLAATTFRRFAEELILLIGKRVAVSTTYNKTYEGDLVGIDENLNIVLNNVSGVSDKVFKVVINGKFVQELSLIEKPFDLKALADRLSKVFPGMVKLREDIGAIIVMEKIKVTPEGVEGTGLAAEKVKTVYEQFIKEVKQTQP
ncbi:MAG: Lsm family RNA-binding protein [Nitrososphaerales archaeon]